MLVFYVTHPNLQHAEKIAIELLEKKLIACANFMPITSIYPWKGEIQNDNEVASILKTSDSNKQEVIDTIKDLHDYELPCIIWSNVESTDEYGAWIMSNSDRSMWWPFLFDVINFIFDHNDKVVMAYIALRL